MVQRVAEKIQRSLCYMAGIDRRILAGCPATDKLWATHLGFSLFLSFFVVLGISFHATGYVVENVWMRLLVATVVALTLFMFDRALYQSDWFFQGILRRSADDPGIYDRSGFWKFLRITMRLVISFGLAWILSVFLELAIFSDTINEKIKSEHLVANRSIYEKIEKYEAQLDEEIKERRKILEALEPFYQRELAEEISIDPSVPREFNGYEEQKKVLHSQEQELQSELREIKNQITSYQEDMNAEELGQRLRPYNSTLAGRGPRYEFAKKQKEIYVAKRIEIEDRISQLASRQEQLTFNQRHLQSEAQARLNQDRLSSETKRRELQGRIERLRAELASLDASRTSRIETFRSNALRANDFQKLKDDPLSRITAYQQLKSDPKDGETIVLFSWMTKVLIIFLEVVPVLAKMFFCPPSVYAARIQAQVWQSEATPLVKLAESREPFDEGQFTSDLLDKSEEPMDEGQLKRELDEVIQNHRIKEFPKSAIAAD
jgi:hypothetical protein